MSKFELNVMARTTIETMRLAFELAFRHNAAGGAATGYAVSEEHGLVFLWSPDGEGAVPFPFRMDVEGAVTFAFHWLAQQKYPPQPDHDGSNEKGFRVYVGEWGHVGPYRYSICAVQPAWAVYAK